MDKYLTHLEKTKPNSQLEEVERIHIQVDGNNSFMENIYYNIRLYEHDITGFIKQYPILLDKVHYENEAELALAMTQFRMNFDKLKRQFEQFL